MFRGVLAAVRSGMWLGQASELVSAGRPKGTIHGGGHSFEHQAAAAIDDAMARRGDPRGRLNAGLLATATALRRSRYFDIRPPPPLPPGVTRAVAEALRPIEQLAPPRGAALAADDDGAGGTAAAPAAAARSIGPGRALPLPTGAANGPGRAPPQPAAPASAAAPARPAPAPAAAAAAPADPHAVSAHEAIFRALERRQRHVLLLRGRPRASAFVGVIFNFRPQGTVGRARMGWYVQVKLGGSEKRLSRHIAVGGERAAARAVDQILLQHGRPATNAPLLSKLELLRASGYYEKGRGPQEVVLPAGVSKLEAAALRPCG